MLLAIVDLIAEKLGFIPSENLFINAYPDSPDTIISVIDNGGFPPKLYEPTREKVVDIKIRAGNYDEGQALGEQVFKLFHDKENYELNNKKILHSRAYTDVSYLFSDSKEREEFSIELVFLYLNL
ncbi:minor capsid protein [Neobacillus mesonae]|uniref:minor capsid protein n=1 Tax=Neobacillus mesonae TaxID=1193713 RepID=UPI002573B39E|nr:minor capsid protein [Neobacillus mesonae]